METLASAVAFRGMSDCELVRLSAVATHIRLHDEQLVFARGDKGHNVYLIQSGNVRISTLAASGKRLTVEIFARNDLFGELAAIDGGTRSADATAMGPVELLAIPVASFRDVLAVSVVLANNLLRLSNERLRRTYMLLEDASLRPLDLRLARQLLYLTKLGTTGQSSLRLQVRMHQDELADLLGVTTRSIINVLNKWRGEGLVSFDGRAAQLTILDIERFRALTSE